MHKVHEALIPNSEGGLGWDVHVRDAPDRYDARTVIRIVKLINRRGMVRYFLPYGGKWYQFVKETERVAGVDDHLEWVAERLDDDELHVSFSDRFEARKFAGDLNSLSTTAIPMPSQADLAGREKALAARRTVAQQFYRNDYPGPLIFRHKDGWKRQGFGWLVMVHPHLRNPAKLEAWMRQNLESRYWPAVWRPGEPPYLLKKSYRYWHLKAEQWQTLFDQCHDTDSLLIVHFHMKTDLDIFDGTYGPSSLL